MQSELTEIRKSVRNALGAIESNQVVDKDVHGTLSRVLSRLDTLTAALSDKQAGEVEIKPLEIDDIIEELLDAQQDINFAANSYMDQSLCDASALIDRVEAFLVRIRSALAATRSASAKNSKGCAE